MREIVHIQAGQCGNQIGAKVSWINWINYSHINWEYLCGLKVIKVNEYCWKFDEEIEEKCRLDSHNWIPMNTKKKDRAKKETFISVRIEWIMFSHFSSKINEK
jgi:hypothetical protein